MAQRRTVRAAGRSRGRIPAQGLTGLHRRALAHPQVAGQAGQRSLQHGNHRGRNADAGRTRWRRRRRSWRCGCEKPGRHVPVHPNLPRAAASATPSSTTTFPSSPRSHHARIDRFDPDRRGVRLPGSAGYRRLRAGRCARGPQCQGPRARCARASRRGHGIRGLQARDARRRYLCRWRLLQRAHQLCRRISRAKC